MDLNNMQVQEQTESRETSAPKVQRSIVLVGLMGAGKSTVGRRLATALHLPFHDADQEIETAAGCSISDFFERYGEQAFRDGERRVIARLLDGPRHVLATGGGAFMDPGTRDLRRTLSRDLFPAPCLDRLVRGRRRLSAFAQRVASTSRAASTPIGCQSFHAVIHSLTGQQLLFQ